MSEHRVELDWKRETEGFSYKEYSRNHTWRFGNGEVVRASAAVDYLGDAGCVDPEAAFVASLSGCHALTFLALASIGKLRGKGKITNQYLLVFFAITCVGFGSNSPL